MFRARVGLLGLVVVFAFSAFMSATASANTSHVFLIEQTELTKTEAVEDQSQNTRVELALKGTLFVIECQEDLSSGTIGPEGKSEFKIEFKNCFVFKSKEKTGKKEFLTKCPVKEPVVAEGSDELTEHSIDTFEKFKGTLVLEDGAECLVAGEYIIEGTQLCAVPESTFEKAIHHLICTPAGSALKLKKEPAQFFGEEQIKLKSGRVWAAT